MTDLFLYDEITTEKANKIHNEILEAELNGAEEITININSVGGSIFAGWSIISTMLIKQKAGLVINTHISGIGGSMGGVIAMFGNNVSINDFGLLMVHDPSFNGNGPRNPKEKIIIDKIKASLVSIFTNRRGIDQTKISSLMGAETWLDSSDSLEAGLIDNVINTGLDKKIENKTFEYVFELANSINIKSNKNKNKMKEICNYLNIEETENETLIVEKMENKVNSLSEELETKKAENETVTNTVSGLEATIEEKETSLEALKNQIAEMVVNKAIEEGKIEEGSKSQWVEMAVNDMEKTAGLIASFKTQPVNIINQLEPGQTEKAPETEASFDELRKNDPAKLENMVKNDFKNYCKLYKEKFGVDPVK